MARPATPRRFTVEEYLTIERAAQERSQYVDGQIYAMTGASRAHNVNPMNISSALHTALEKEPCEVYQSDMRVQVAETVLYTYPDVVVDRPSPDHADDDIRPAGLDITLAVRRVYARVLPDAKETGDGPVP